MAGGISTKGRYALRVMADMALSQKEKRVGSPRRCCPAPRH